MKKWIFCFLMICCLSPATVYAQSVSVYLENYRLAPNTMILYGSAPGALTSDTLSVTLSGQSVPLTQVTAFAEADEGTTYLFIVDVSGSIGTQRLAEIKSLLHLIADGFTDKDAASFMMLGNDLSTVPFVTGADMIAAQIDAIVATHEDTNLYAGIIKALDIICSDTQSQGRRCLVLLSDGEDDFITGYTREEVNDKIRAARVPVHTIAMLKKNASARTIDNAKIFGSFARISPGGLDLTYGLDDTPLTVFAAQLTETVASGFVLTADISGLQLTADQSLLEIKRETPHGSATDSVMINAVALREMIVPPDMAAESGTDDENEKRSGADTEKGSGTDAATGITTIAIKEPEDKATGLPLWMIPVIGAAVALILAAVVVMVIMRMRKKKNVEPPPHEPPTPAISPTLSVVPPVVSAPQAPVHRAAPLYKLIFTKIGLLENERYTFDFTDEVVIGREAGRSAMTFPHDSMLSGRHCRIMLREGKLYLEDLSSANGTYLNGVPVLQPCPLERDDILMIGSMELRITW